MIYKQSGWPVGNWRAGHCHYGAPRPAVNCWSGARAGCRLAVHTVPWRHVEARWRQGRGTSRPSDRPVTPTGPVRRPPRGRRRAGRSGSSGRQDSRRKGGRVDAPRGSSASRFRRCPVDNSTAALSAAHCRQVPCALCSHLRHAVNHGHSRLTTHIAASIHRISHPNDQGLPSEHNTPVTGRSVTREPRLP